MRDASGARFNEISPDDEVFENGCIIVGEPGARLPITGASSGCFPVCLKWSAPFDDASNLKRHIVAIYAGLITANVAAWLWALAEFHDHPLLLGTALLAYVFGLRHAFPAGPFKPAIRLSRKRCPPQN